MNYVGAALKLTEAQLALQPIQMGARVYIPGLGRFLSVDPVQGGTDNNYVYASDPVNDFDLDGTFSFKNAIKNSWNWVGRNAGTIGIVAAGGALAACVVATAGVCGAVVAASTAISAVSSVAQTRVNGGSWLQAGDAGIVSVASDKILKPMKAVRGFGDGRNYKSIGMALSKSPGVKRAYANFGKFAAGLGINKVSQDIYNAITKPRKLLRPARKSTQMQWR